MKNLDPKYLEKREAKASGLGNEFQKPGSVILLGTVFSGFSIYGISAFLLVTIDVLIKMFS
jgi:hypothetical protein